MTNSLRKLFEEKYKHRESLCQELLTDFFDKLYLACSDRTEGDSDFVMESVEDFEDTYDLNIEYKLND